MIRKYARVSEPAEAFLQVFADTDSWSSWMPGVRSVHVLKRSPDSIVATIESEYGGRRISQTVESLFQGQTVRQRQVSGRFRKWDLLWRFMKPPEGQGTTISCEFDVEVGGLMGLFASGRFIQRIIDRLFDETVAKARSRIPGADSAGKEGQEEDRREILLEIYEADGCLELSMQGKRYRLDSFD